MEHRRATIADSDALARLGRTSFVAAFGHVYDPADLNRFLDSAYAPETIAQEIAGTEFDHRLMIENDALTGYVKIQPASPYAEYSDAARPLCLNQLYTDPAMTGRGIGAQLMDWVIETAGERQADAIQLSVWSENFGAQRFYQRYGFAKIADIDFWVGNHRDDEFLYELKL
ncbi:GNAT family N-acetyltransferase [Altericroceibacterium spongiae]|uniref:GNAT family N-acetyltransferase n=1 Tax=Altericroceibacterium spongiae TaxID=2320269 RepID=UPI001EE53302|nr:GNAT family N-acetyltransferase [Altericroceibacterium spongiae]